MDKKIILWAIVTVLLISLASAIPDPDESFTFTGNLDNSVIDAITTFGNSGASADVDRFGNSAESYECNSAEDDYMEFSQTWDADHTFTISYWVRDDRASYVWSGIFGAVTQSGGGNGMNSAFVQSGVSPWTAPQMIMSKTSTTPIDALGPDLGNWGHYVITYSHANDTMSVYVNGTYYDTATSWTWTDTYTQRFCRYFHDTTALDGDIHLDDLNYWNNTLLTDLEIKDLWGNESVEATRNYDFWGSAAAPALFEITAADYYNNISITNFSATVNGTTYTTINGTITTTISNSYGGEFDVYIINATNSYGDYFNITYSDYNISINLIAYPIQSQIEFQGLEYITSDILTGQFYINDSLVTIPSYMSAGYYNVTFVNVSYFNKTAELFVTPLFNGTLNISDVYSSQLNISVKNGYTSNPINGFSGWVYNEEYAFNTTFNTTGNFTLINLSYDTFYIYVEADGYAISDSSNYQNVTLDEINENVSFSLWSNNSIFCNIYDEQTLAYILANVTITLENESYSNNYYTINGTYFFEDIVDGNYTIKFNSANYTQKSYTVTVADRSTQQLDAYLNNDYEEVIFTVIDDLNGAVLENANVLMSRLINSTWITTENKNTDITGRAQISYLPYTQYRFYITIAGYQDKLFYLDPILYSYYTIRMDRDIDIDPSPSDYSGVNLYYYPSLFYNDEENTFTMIISSDEGTLENFGVYLQYPEGVSTVSSNNSIGDQIEIDFNITNAQFYDKVNITLWYDTVYTSNKTFYYEYSIVGFNANNQTWLSNLKDDYGFGDLEKALITIFAVIVAAGMSYIIAGNTGALVMGLLTYGFFIYLGFIPIWAVLITFLAGTVIVIGRSD